jgi:predicted O-methyltransferase YrrM
MANLNGFIEYIAQNNFPDFIWNPDVIGWCNPKQGTILNNAVSRFLEKDETYLEIGSFCGKSLVAALHGNNVNAHVIDPLNLKVSTSNTEFFWNQTVDAYNIRNRITLHRTLSHLFNDELPPIGVFYADGDHDAGHTYNCLKQFSRYFADRAIIIADDYNIVGDIGYHGIYTQKPFPGYEQSTTPVKDDVDRWISETKEATLIDVTPWHTGQAIIGFER